MGLSAVVFSSAVPLFQGPTMSDQPADPGPQPPPGPGPISQEFQHPQVSARVPEKVGRGAFSTGLLVLQGQHEFVLDFVQGMVQPRQIVARVVVAPAIVPSIISALRDNLSLYQNQFGPLPALRPPPPPPKPPSIEDIYGQFKLPDELLSGADANVVMITHSQSEFCLDFITSFYPRSAVACRVFLAAAQMPGVLNTLAQSFQQYQQKIAAKNKPPELPPS
jgi:hypothetical protein